MQMPSRDEEFSAFVASRRPQLCRAAYLLCGDVHRAEDVVQSALARLYVAWPRVARADSPDAYVRRALVNSHIDEGRRPWRRERATEFLRSDPSNAGPSLEDVDALFVALHALPAGQRRVVVLRHYWGQSVEETAADLGISTGTVKSQTAAAIKKLRLHLEPEPVEGNR